MHLETFPVIPADWRNDALDAKWDKIRRVRSVVTGALEIERAAKRIGSSLEAAPTIYIKDQFLFDAVKETDLSEVCITSGAELVHGLPPRDANGDTSAFMEIASDVLIAVVPTRAAGTKCARSWRYTTDVGSDPAFPDLSARDAAAMREIEAARG